MKCSSSCIHRFNRPIQVSILLTSAVLKCPFVHMYTWEEMQKWDIPGLFSNQIPYVIYSIFKQFFLLKILLVQCNAVIYNIYILGFNNWTVLLCTDFNKVQHGYSKLAFSLKFTLLNGMTLWNKFSFRPAYNWNTIRPQREKKQMYLLK